MTSKLIVGLAALSLGLAGAAQAQETTSTTRVGPAGGVHTTTTNAGPGGVATTHTVDRPDGTRVVSRRVTDANGDTRSVRHVAGSNTYRVCHSMWRHGQRIRRCTVRQR